MPMPALLLTGKVLFLSHVRSI